MDFVNLRSENTVRRTGKTTKLKTYIRCDLLLHNCNNNKIGPFITFPGIKEKISIRLRLSTFVYPRLVTRLLASTFISIRL